MMIVFDGTCQPSGVADIEHMESEVDGCLRAITRYQHSLQVVHSSCDLVAYDHLRWCPGVLLGPAIHIVLLMIIPNTFASRDMASGMAIDLSHLKGAVIDRCIQV